MPVPVAEASLQANRGGGPPAGFPLKLPVTRNSSHCRSVSTQPETVTCTFITYCEHSAICADNGLVGDGAVAACIRLKQQDPGRPQVMPVVGLWSCGDYSRDSILSPPGRVPLINRVTISLYVVHNP